jgi:hypothetical protein
MPPSKQQHHRTHLADMYTVKASEEEEHCQHNDKRRRLSGLFRSGPGRLLLIALFFALLGPQYLSLVSMKKTTDAPPRDISITTSKVTSDINKLTVLISTYNQTACLERLVKHLQTCSVVDEIRINWFQDSPIPQSLSNNNNNSSHFAIPVIFDILPNKISHRFLPRPRRFSTDAIFNMDVDMAFSCDALQLVMETWSNQANQTHTAVGFFPRHLPADKYYKFDESHHEPYTRNTLFITKGGLIHKDRLEDFFHPSLQPFINHVDEHITAEDMLMSFVMASKQVKMITLCVPRSYWCNIHCMSTASKYEKLNDRSGRHRGHLMALFRDYFGYISTDEGNNPMIWHGENNTYGDDCNTELNYCGQYEWMKRQ